MSDEKNKSHELDEFWDISSLVPKKSPLRSSPPNTETVEISDAGDIHSENTVIKRFISPHHKNEWIPKMKECFSYSPENSLIHKVTLYREECAYDFYADFVSEARRLWNVHGTECPYADFFSYSPQYNQLNSTQLSYYLWWRENLRNNIYLKSNLYYIYLYMFELINVSDEAEALTSRNMMLSVIEHYTDIIRGAMSRCIRWICDFSLLHRLEAPIDFSPRLLSEAGTLKEYFVRIPGNTPDGWAWVLLKYCCSYDYRTSKFATPENIPLYAEHVTGALSAVVRSLSKDGKIFSALPFGDCRVTAKLFEGAVCSSANKYTVAVEYCSFSRSHELRFIVGDTVKYSENKIRAHLGIKSRLTVYSLPLELCGVIDEYFDLHLPAVRRAAKREQEPPEYDAFYDLPKHELNLSNASRIELESWDTTRELIAESDVEFEPVSGTVAGETYEENGEGFGIYTDALCALRNGDASVLCSLAYSLSRPVEAVVDMINERSVELLGDIIIEDTENGYMLIEDYADEIGGRENTND